MLEAAGLSETDLATPPAWPEGANRDRIVGTENSRRLPVYHNCSGKHAAFLAACVASGWSVVDYLEPQHPIQMLVRDVLFDATGEHPPEIGVDG